MKSEGLCDKCDQPAVTDRKVIFAYTELCSDHAAEYDARNDRFAVVSEMHRARRDMIRIGR